MIIPPYLKKGDSVAVIATARKISKEELQFAIDELQSHELNVVLGPNLFQIYNQFAGTDEQRAKDLQWALDNQTIKAILIARGGYGTVRVMGHINFEHFLKSPKWIVGYSDVTVLHSAINKVGVASLHATMPINFNKHKQATQSLIDALFGNTTTITTEPHHLNKLGKVTGEIIGGNLSLLYALASTTYDIDTTDKILFIEDLDEYLYHIDRMMMQLKLSGKLKSLKALVVGGMTDMKDNPVPFGKFPDEIIIDAVKEYNYPVCFDFPAGHIDENMALYFGKEVTLSITEGEVTLSYNPTT